MKCTGPVAGAKRSRAVANARCETRHCMSRSCSSLAPSTSLTVSLAALAPFRPEDSAWSPRRRALGGSLAAPNDSQTTTDDCVATTPALSEWSKPLDQRISNVANSNPSRHRCSCRSTRRAFAPWRRHSSRGRRGCCGLGQRACLREILRSLDNSNRRVVQRGGLRLAIAEPLGDLGELQQQRHRIRHRVGSHQRVHLRLQQCRSAREGTASLGRPPKVLIEARCTPEQFHRASIFSTNCAVLAAATQNAAVNWSAPNCSYIEISFG